MRKPKTVNELQLWRQSLFNRRQFLLGSVGGVLTLLFYSSTYGKEVTQKAKISDEQGWKIVQHLHRHLLPTEKDSPGADEINTLGYLQQIYENELLDKKERDFIIGGVVWLENLSLQMNKKSFVDLNETQREAILKKITQSPAGENWLSTVLVYVIEATLTDPVYGGNKNQSGWKWLQHRPGYPTPDKNKRYFLLHRQG